MDELDDVTIHIDNAPEESISEKEVNLYRSLPVAAKDLEPLQWWQQNKTTFPTLAKLSKRYLCIPATSVPSEREFSAAGNIVSAKRNCLKPGKVNELCFLASNLKRLALE